MAAAGKVVSRKAKRKLQREDKKRLKNKRQRGESAAPEAPASGGSRSRGVKGGPRPASHGKKPSQTARRNGGGITNKFQELLEETAGVQTADGAVKSLGAEDREIKALESKLGLGSSSNKSTAALKKLKKCVGIGGGTGAGAKVSASAGSDGDVESDEEEEAEGEESDEEDEIGGGDDMEMDEETRREMALLQAEDAEFLKGMDELPTDESDLDSDEDLATFYSDEEDEGEDEDEEADDNVLANTLRNQQAAAADDANEGEDSDEDEGDDGGEEEEEEVEAESEEEQEKECVVIEEDIYGRPVVKAGDGAKKPSAYLPPHLRRKLQAEAEAAAAAASVGKVKPSQMDEQAVRELTRRINGHLNRISESNMESITLEMEKLYRENVRSLVNQILLEKLLQTTCHPRQVMTPLIKVAGALVAALYHSVGSEVGGFFVEKLVRKLMDSVQQEQKQQQEAAESNADDEDDDGEDAARTSKEPVNLMLFVMMLYNFGVVHCTLVYDLFRAFVDSFSSTDIELIHQLLKAGGSQLRADDADALR
ncbi:hypothetical protein BBJ28_00026686, partial [Nothophytophthora sp. Chile5]